MMELDIFVRQIEDRSNEHRRAIELLAGAQLAGQIVAILRQELDSMIRVIYLLSLSLERRNTLISASVNGQAWGKEKSNGRITDHEMIKLAQRLEGWAQSVYKFGCAFIHLSALHDYRHRDPISLLPACERDDLIRHCRHYHGGPVVEYPAFHDFLPYLPQVFEKIAGNLECYLEDLRFERGLNDIL